MEFERENTDEEFKSEEKKSDEDEISDDEQESDSDDNEEQSSDDELETGGDDKWSDIDWSEVNSDEEQESIWNEIDWKESEQTDLDVSDATEGNEERDEFEHNDPEEESEQESDQNDLEGDVEQYDPYERGDNYGQEGYSGEFENQYAQTMNTILITENQMIAYLREYAQAQLEKERENQGEENKADILENEPSELEQFLEQEKERIQLEQQQAELNKTGSEEQDSEPIAAENDLEQENRDDLIDPDHEPALNEETIEQEQFKEVNPQIYSTEDNFPSSEEDVNHQKTTKEFTEFDLERTKIDEELNEENLDIREVKHEEEQVGNDLEEMEIEAYPEEEIERIQEQDSNEIETVFVYQEELELEDLNEELEINEFKRREIDDPQQELEETLEQITEIEQDAPNETESNEHTIEQEKEKEWLEYLSNWVKEDAGERLHPQMKEDLTEIVDDYNELDELTARFQELYKKEQTELLSQEEKVELKGLIKTLYEKNPEHIILFTNIRAIKRYLSHQRLEKSQLKQLLNHFLTQFPPKKQLNRILKASKNQLTLRILNFTPRDLVKIIEQLGSKFKKIIFDVQDKTYLQKKNKHTISSKYSDGDIEFWIELFKLKYYGGSWPKVFNFIRDFNKHLNRKIGIPNQFNDMTYFVKKYFKQNSLIYEEFKVKHGNRKSTQTATDEDVIKWIKIYQDREVGGSISAIRKNLENHQGYTYGETTIRRHIKKFFQNNKYAKYFGADLSYEGWMKMYKRKYFREDLPLDPKIQSHEYILLFKTKTNQYQCVFIKDLENPEFLKNMEEFQILGISNKLQPEKVNIRRFMKTKPQESLEIICNHGSVIITPDQFLFTIDNDCNIIEIKGSELKIGMPILMPRILKINPNNEPLDLINCGMMISKNNVQYIEQFDKKAYRFVKKNAKLGAILGQYEAEGTFPSKYQPATVISVSTDYEYIQKLQKIVKEVFGLEFQIIARRVKECKNCGSKTIENGNQNICPKCENGIYNECYELRTKTKLAKSIFTQGLGLKHAYSYLKELPSFLYNSTPDCEKGFISSYFKGDGSERDYRTKGGTFDLNFETTSRRLVFGLNLLMKKLGVIMSVSVHDPPSTRPNSKKLYSMVIRGSSNFEKLKHIFDNLPEIDYTTSDIKTAANTHALIRKLNLELQKTHGISLRDLSNKGIVPENATHIATQIKRKTNLSEVLLLKTLDGLKNENITTSLIKKLERVFRNNTFTKIKKINSSKTTNETYKIFLDRIGYCSGTAFVYVKSEENTKEE